MQTDDMIKHRSTIQSISVFFPCYNEKDSIRPLTEKTISFLTGEVEDFEVILVDDGSSDGTGTMADELAAAYPEVRVVHHERNQGYGAALQSGFRAARKDFVFYTDGDNQFDISEITKLFPLAEQFDIVSAYRINRQDGLLRKFNAFCWTKLVGLLFDLPFKDIDCAFKLYKRDVFKNIEMHSTGALIDTEILARARRKGYTITQIGVHHYPRTAGSSTGANPGVILRAFKELFKLRKEILKMSK